MRNILEIRDLQVHYGGIEAVRGISLDVPEGEIVTLIGANGAGKSSTLRAIAGLVKPSAGKISFLDEDITGMDSSLIVSKGITLVPEGRRIFPDMTVLENLKINKQGVTVLLIEQNANMALKTANLGYVMETGRITLHGSGEELLANEAVKAAYLGT